MKEAVRLDLLTVAYLFSNMLMMLSIERMMGVFFDKRRTPLLVWLGSFLLYYVASAIAFLLLNTPMVTLAINIITFFIIALNYESTTKKRIAAVLGTFCILATLDTLITLIFGLYQANVFEPQEIDNILQVTLVGVVLYIGALLLRRFKNIKNSAINTPIFWLSTLSVPGLSFVLTLFVVTYLPPHTALIALLIILAINLLTLYLQNVLAVTYQDKLQSALHTQEKEYYYAQCQLMQESVDKMKTYRHDVKMHLSAIQGFAAKINAHDIIAYLDSLMGSITINEIYSDTGNTAFDSIINFKLKDAVEDNIKVDVSVLAPPTLNIEVVDIVTILGNLLDNALDAVAKVEDKVINLHVKASKGNLLIKVENTFDGNVKYAGKAIATRKTGDGHGYGLKNIRRAVERYNGYVDISHDGGVFAVQVLVYGDG